MKIDRNWKNIVVALTAVLFVMAAGCSLGGSEPASNNGSTTSCTVNSDCSTGQICQNGACVAQNTGCTTNADCSSGQICQSGSCVAQNSTNTSPVINSISITPIPVVTTANLSCSASDSDGDTLIYTWNIGGINVATGVNATWNSPNIPGNYDAVVTVDDGHGNVVTGGTYITATSNAPWPRFHYNMQSTGLSPFTASSDLGALKWSYTTGFWIESSPAIGVDGTICVGSLNYNLYAIH